VKGLLLLVGTPLGPLLLLPIPPSWLLLTLSLMLESRAGMS
jgi:hypothetical protein